ncbi:TBC domain-containing protein [Cyclospora cayetanensis]|uniref:TBC domain-containing protein n=1 Tax=Cyclospora cayetanensis TaxID=88456 RepID=A0A1D3D1F2_9EIME|nr:TBC domain-containing protein [Cyclospora cayetanensis]
MSVKGSAEARVSAELSTPTKEVDALQLEVTRLREEKRLAGEIFAETICSYEDEVRQLKEALATTQQQLRAVVEAAPLAVERRRQRSHSQPREQHERVAGTEGIEDATAASSGNSVQGDNSSPRDRSLASSHSMSDRQTKHNQTADTADHETAPVCSRSFSRKWIRTRIGSPPEVSEASAVSRGGAGFFYRKQTSEALDGRSLEREQSRGISSLPRISSHRSWKTLLFSKERFTSGKMVLTSDPAQTQGIYSWRYGRARRLGGPEGGLQGAPSSAVWVDSILPDWETQRETAAFEVILQLGVPHDVRGEAIGDQMRLTPKFYELLVARMDTARRHLLRTNSKYRERIEYIGGSTMPASTHAQEAESGAHQQPTEARTVQNSKVCSLCGSRTDGPSETNLPSSGTEGSRSSDKAESSDCIGRDCFMWEGEVFTSFLAISADLHRTLPRLGLFSSRPTTGWSKPNAEAAPNPAPDLSDSLSTPMGSTLRAHSLEFAVPSDAARPTPEEARADDKDSSNNSSCNSWGENADAVDLCASEGRSSATEDVRSSSFPCCEGGQGTQRPLQGLSPERRAAAAPPDSQAVAPVPFGMAGGEKMETFLQTVLEAYVMLRPDLGYVQGMAFIAATLLLYMDEYSAFVCFANLMLRRSLHAFYTFDMPVVEIYFRTFDALLEERHPQLLTHFEQIGIETDVFLVDWMYTLFTRYTRCVNAHNVLCRLLTLPTPLLLLSLPSPIATIDGHWVWSRLNGREVAINTTSLAIVSYFHQELQEGSLDECMAILSPSTTTRFQAIQASRGTLTDKFIELLFAIRILPQSEAPPSRTAKGTVSAAAAGDDAVKVLPPEETERQSQRGDTDVASARFHRRSFTWTVQGASCE